MKELIFYSQNLRSMCNFDELVTHLQTNAEIFSNLGILAVQETWSIHGRNTKIPGFHKPYILTRNDKDGGGVGLWINQKLSFDILHEFDLFEENVIETQTIKFIGKNNKINIIMNVYRPPNSNTAYTTQKLMEILDKIEAKFQKIPIFIMGDFNLDLYKRSQHAGTDVFYESLENRDYHPQILESTRITAKSSTLIDNIFVKNTKTIEAQTDCSNVSDHLGCWIKVQYSCITEPNQSYIKNFKKYNNQNIKHALSNATWNMNSTNVESLYNSFNNKLSTIMDNNCTIKIYKNKKYIPRNPWMSKEILILRNKLIKSQRKSLKKKT